MGKLPALVDRVTEVDGRERKTIEHYARTIREQGYISTTKRGSGAADMMSPDAANLLIGLSGADTAKEAPAAIERIRSLKQYYEGDAAMFRARADLAKTGIAPIRRVLKSRTFGPALEGLIETVPELVAHCWKYWTDLYEGSRAGVLEADFLSILRLRTFGLDITLERHAASIELYTTDHVRRSEFLARFHIDPRNRKRPYGLEEPDRRPSVSIGAPTLIAAWQALNPGVALPGIPARALAVDDGDSAP